MSLSVPGRESGHGKSGLKPELFDNLCSRRISPRNQKGLVCTGCLVGLPGPPLAQAQLKLENVERASCTRKRFFLFSGDRAWVTLPARTSSRSNGEAHKAQSLQNGDLHSIFERLKVGRPAFQLFPCLTSNHTASIRPRHVASSVAPYCKIIAAHKGTQKSQNTVPEKACSASAVPVEVGHVKHGQLNCLAACNRNGSKSPALPKTQ